MMRQVFDVYSSGVTAHTAVYRTPQMAFFNFDRQQTYNNTSDTEVWGKGSRQTHLVRENKTGTNFVNCINGGINGGKMTFVLNGYYKIRVSSNLQQVSSINDRLAFANYLVIGSTDYFENQSYNFFGWGYTRNTSDGAHQNVVFEDYIYITANTVMEVRAKLDVNNRTFDDERAESNLRNYLNVQIERIAETDIS